MSQSRADTKQKKRCKELKQQNQREEDYFGVDLVHSFLSNLVNCRTSSEGAQKARCSLRIIISVKASLFYRPPLLLLGTNYPASLLKAFASSIPQ